MTQTAKAKEPLHPEEVVTPVFLIRHGHTGATEQGVLYSDPAAELTDAGRQQALKAGHWMVEHGIDVLLSSSSKRVTTSAEIISEVISVSLQTVNDLNEWHVGEWEGRAYVDIKAEDPELYKAWVNDPILNKPPGGESIADVCKRTELKLQELIAAHEGKKIALVTHAGIIRSAIVSALHMNVRDFWRVVIPVGSVSRIDYSASFAALQFMSVKP
ncbi:MAG TPA: histidine phosphatase family protein [Oculatellaceae cyanobacterium]